MILMKSPAYIRFRMISIAVLGVFCVYAALSSRFVRPSHTQHDALIINAALSLFGLACFVQAHFLKRELKART
jgi:hypothetical protein